MTIARAIIERLSRKIVLKRRLPRKHGGGRIIVTPDAALRLWRYNLEKADVTLFRCVEEFVQSGQTVWDIGGNVGLFALSAAHKAGRKGQVIVLEPDIVLAQLLRRSSGLQPSDSAEVIVLPCAASEGVGIEWFDIANRGRASNHLQAAGGSSQAGGVRESVPVLTLSLDDILTYFPAPDVLKTDVEGAEALVLRGAEVILAKHRPVIICEVASINKDEVTSRLLAHEYELFDALVPPRDRRRLSMATHNTIALPRPGEGPLRRAAVALRSQAQQ
jgi:FkbM family methyltransferase